MDNEGLPQPGDKFTHQDFGILTYVSNAGDRANTTLSWFTDENGKPVSVSMTDFKLKRMANHAAL